MSKSGDFASFNAIDFINRRKKMTEVGGIAVDRLRSLIERIERLEEEKKPSPETSVTFLPKPNPPAST